MFKGTQKCMLSHRHACTRPLVRGCMRACTYACVRACVRGGVQACPWWRGSRAGPSGGGAATTSTALSRTPASIFGDLFGACRERTPRGRSEDGIEKVSVARVFVCLEIGAGPRRSPSRCRPNCCACVSACVQASAVSSRSTTPARAARARAPRAGAEARAPGGRCAQNMQRFGACRRPTPRARACRRKGLGETRL